VNLWFLFAAMTLVAIAFVAWPLYRQEHKLTLVLAMTIIGIAGLSAGLYYKQGQPDIPSGASMSPDSEHDMKDVVAALAERLRSNPDDVGGWLMLGRSYSSLGDYAAANDAFENALEVAPDDPQALFYGGVAASNRNELALAANRWERLLELGAPPEIQETLRQGIAQWRGAPVATAGSSTPERAAAPVPDLPPEGTVVSIDLSLSKAAQAAMTRNAGVFIIARDPAAPSPPIAVTRRSLSALPTTVHLGDSESMVQGRNLSMFEQFELVARISLSGQPGAQSGDWYGSVIVTPAEASSVTLAISEQVP
jgi:cytochrome c-type biogenesis protein CcmH